MNKKKTYIGTAIIVLIFGIIVIPKIFERIYNDDVVSGDRLNVVSGIPEETPGGELSYITIEGKDRKVPPFEFVNQEGDTITQNYYKGKVFVVEFFFTRCPNICIPMSKNLVKIQDEFKGDDNFGIASFSIDPENDSPEVLKKYAEAYGATHKHWNFLTGDREEIYELSNSGFNLNAQYNPDVSGGFYHSGMFALIDQNGFIRSRLDQYGNPIVYYRGSIPADAQLEEGEQTPQIDILIEDIKALMK